EDGDTALRLLGNVSVPGMSGVALAFRSAADVAVGLPGASDHPNLPTALAAAGWFAYQRGDPELALQRCDEATAAEQRLGVQSDPQIWRVRAFIAMGRGAFDEYVDYIERASAEYRARSDNAGAAITLAQAAVGRALAGNTAGAFRAAEEALAVARTIEA